MRTLIVILAVWITGCAVEHQTERTQTGCAADEQQTAVDEQQSEWIRAGIRYDSSKPEVEWSGWLELSDDPVEFTLSRGDLVRVWTENEKDKRCLRFLWARGTAENKGRTYPYDAAAYKHPVAVSQVLSEVNPSTGGTLFLHVNQGDGANETMPK